MPARVWTATSLLFWMSGINNDSIPTYRQRKQSLENYSEEIINYAEQHGKCIIVAHGVVNRELIRILKKKGWEFEDKDGFGNLSVNCLKK
jgi:broad specificity phosphatase PhoE